MPFQDISTLPEDFKGEKSSADIHISPDGNFLYSSNRGDANSLAIFSIDENGVLSSLGWQPTLGKTPRNFVIDPTGNLLLAANQDSDEVVIFRRDIKTGLLSDTGERIMVYSPACLKFGMSSVETYLENSDER
jgi:6-phosphogluconolactonase